MRVKMARQTSFSNSTSHKIIERISWKATDMGGVCGGRLRVIKKKEPNTSWTNDKKSKGNTQLNIVRFILIVWQNTLITHPSAHYILNPKVNV